MIVRRICALQTRWVTDLREFNKQMVEDSYSLTNIQEILHSLQGATVFSSLDPRGAYHAVRIKTWQLRLNSIY